MMTLYYTPRSPYASKVRLVALEKGLGTRLKLVDVDLKNKPESLVTANPLGKIPCLVLQDGEALFDSVVIAEYLDSLSASHPLIPQNASDRFRVLTLASLADGIADAMIAAHMEDIRAEEKKDLAIVTAQEKKVLDSIAYLEKNIKELSDAGITLAHMAVAASLGYVDIRGAHLNWRNHAPKLAAWFAEFSKRPSAQEALPKLPKAQAA